MLVFCTALCLLSLWPSGIVSASSVGDVGIASWLSHTITRVLNVGSLPACLPGPDITGSVNFLATC